jgi:hypothetical protein
MFLDNIEDYSAFPGDLRVDVELKTSMDSVPNRCACHSKFAGINFCIVQIL